MVSRVHINDMNLGKCAIFVSEHVEGPYIEIVKGMCIPHGKERIVKMGSVPCRFIKLHFEKEIKKISEVRASVHGLPYGGIAEKIECGAEQYLFETPYRLVYGEK